MALGRTLASPRYQPKLLNFGSATDAYQPVERRLRVTRAVILELSQIRHAFSLVTRSAGVEPDLDLIAPIARERLGAVYVSVTSLDSGLSRILETRAASTPRRLTTIATLARAGVIAGVSVSPIIPFISEPEIERVLEAAAQAGATSAFMVVLRLPREVNSLFQGWLQQHFPQRAERVMARVREMRGGKDNDPRFGNRMKGERVWAQFCSSASTRPVPDSASIASGSNWISPASYPSRCRQWVSSGGAVLSCRSGAYARRVKPPGARPLLVPKATWVPFVQKRWRRSPMVCPNSTLSLMRDA